MARDKRRHRVTFGMPEKIVNDFRRLNVRDVYFDGEYIGQLVGVPDPLKRTRAGSYIWTEAYPGTRSGTYARLADVRAAILKSAA